MNKDDKEQRKNLSQDLLKKLSENGSQKRQSLATKRLSFFLLMRRIMHILIVIPLLPIVFIFHFLLLLRYVFTRKPVYTVNEYYGKKGKTVKIKNFNIEHFSHLSLFYHVISGKLSLTGYSLNKTRAAGDAFIYDYAPGLINLWYIRSSSRTAYEGIKETDKEFVNNELLKAQLNPGIKSFILLFKAEFMLFIRFMIAKFFRSLRKVNYANHILDPVFLFNVRLRNISLNIAVEAIKNTIETAHNSNEKRLRRKIYFVNPDCFNKTFEKATADYKEMLQNITDNDWIFADGIGVNIAIDMLGYPKNENVNGTDLLPRLAELAAENQYSIYLLGARPGVAETMKENLEKMYPGIMIKGTHHGYINGDEENRQIIAEINQKKIDILLVAFGVPNQERWIEKWYPHLNTVINIGVGGLFDFYSGRMKRAPRWMRDIGLEWLFRLMMEPRRMFKRYIIGNPVFIRRVKKLQKSADHINKKISRCKKRKEFVLIETAKDRFLIKRHTQLVDIFPLLTACCYKLDIPVYLCWTDNLAAKSCCEVLKKVYPQTDFINEIDDDENRFMLIISDREQTGKHKNDNAVCLIDERFVREFSTLTIQ